MYNQFKEIITTAGIKKGDCILVSSDITRLLWAARQKGQAFSADDILNVLQEIVTDSGTILIPTYNWDFCKGVEFDYFKTKCKTGALGSKALNRNDFSRTSHPIYSFAVWGKDSDLLCKMNNKTSFGENSPFGYLEQMDAKNLIIDVDYQNSITFIHYVEEMSGILPYRHSKEFSALYKDKNGNVEHRTYEMLVRNLSLDVEICFNKIGFILEEQKVSKKYMLDDFYIIVLNIAPACAIIKNDILNNNSRNLCTYKSQ